MTAFVLCVSHNELVADFVLEADVGELAVAAGILTGQALAAGVAVGVCTVDGDDAYEVDAVGEHIAEKRGGSFLEVIDGFNLGGFLAHF